MKSVLARKEPELEHGEESTETDEDETASCAVIPIPPETFIEELSLKLQIHPISVYWLLEELCAEGVRCKPEEQRLLEDRLSVLVLRLLGHRWPRQIEAGEPVPSWADPDGIIPLTAIAGETALAERVRGRLRAEDGDRGAQQVEALLLELTGQTLEEWLRRSFFPAPRAPVQTPAHRLAPGFHADERRGTKDEGQDASRRSSVCCTTTRAAVTCWPGCAPTTSSRSSAWRRSVAADARRRGDETTAAIAVSRVQELEEFATRLRGVEEAGFACADLDRLLADESARPLERRRHRAARQRRRVGRPGAYVARGHQ